MTSQNVGTKMDRASSLNVLLETLSENEFEQRKRELARDIYKACYITGEFKLRSGATSNEYFDKYKFESQPQLLYRVTQLMAYKITKLGLQYDALAGLEMGGVPVGTMLSQHLMKPCVFVRKKPKDYGTCLFAEGVEVPGKELLIIEDVITSGGQVLLSTDDLRSSNAKVQNVFCVILREPSAVEKLAAKGLKLHWLFTGEELKSV